MAEALAAPGQRGLFVILLENPRSDPSQAIMAPTNDLFEQGPDLYGQRPDKSWSRTDCISFVVMAQNGISDALTGDQHFEQAGFRVLRLGQT